MGYRVLYDNQLLFDPYTDDRITDTKLSSKLNAASYFDFTISSTHSLYSKIEERAGEVRIYFNNLILFKGEITKIDEDFEGNYSVSCTGVLDYLTATRVRPYSTVQGEQPLTCPATVDGYFQWLINQHNSTCLDSRKRFSVGVNQGNMLDKNNYIYRSSEQRPTTASEIEDKILNSVGGYLFVRYRDDLNILDLYADVHDVNTQIIDYGVNILDFTKTTTAETQYTAVVATGYTPDPPEGQTDVKMKPITLEGCADGGTPYSSTIIKMGDRVYDVEAVARYGYREYYVSNTDIKTYDGLLEYSCKTLNTLLSPALTISVRAVDLALILGEKYQHLQLGQAVRVRSKPRKVDEYLMVNSIDLDLMNPENTTFDLGASYDTLTGQQSAYLKTLNASINASLDTVSALGDNVKNSATLAQEAKDAANTANTNATYAVEKADTATNTANSAVTKAETATTTATDASTKASEATTKADDAVAKATEATTKANLVEKKAEEAKSAADSAKQAADEANTAAGNAQTFANNANQAATEAKNSADEANTAASNAQSTADSALSSAAQANKDVGNVKTQITEINKEMTSVKQDAATLRDDLTGQITTVKETMEADYTKKSELSATESNLRTEISKSAAGIRTEVSQTYSTKKELETTTKAAQTAQSTADAAKKAAESNASDLANAVSKFNGDISGLKDQIDGAIQTWFYDGIPNALTEPEVNWTTDKDRQTHLGDLYYDNQTGFCYRYMNQNGVYSWKRILDTDVTKALSDAANAQTTANAKKRIFVTTPKPPYDIGDLWVQGSTGDILSCQTPKIDSQTYSEDDWVKASKYTDDTAVTNLSNTVERTYATKSTVNQLSDRIEQTVSSVEEVRTDASAANTAAANAKKAADNAASAAATAQSTASAAQTKATAAASAAATAQTAADKAKENATSAANAAASAQSKANAAQTAADAAKANASAAQTAADAANADLVTAKQNLQDLQGRADATDSEIAAAKTAVSKAQTAADSANSAASKANTAAATAQSTADTAKANAAAAQTKANEAATAASTAQSTANTAKQNAATAQSKANAAASAASTAQSTADTAKANAKKAQDDVNALKNRVTSAETKITQNSEAIALRATKTEVTSAIDNALSESKKYTDAQLKITSDSITSTVSSTYATKTELSTTNGNVTKAQKAANTASSNASTALSTANTAKSTADTVKNDLANLSVGGRNYLSISKLVRASYWNVDYQNGWLTGKDDGDGRAWGYSNCDWKDIKLKAGSYILSVEVKIATNWDAAAVFMYTSSGDSVISKYIANTTGIRHYNFILSSDMTVGLMVKIGNSSGKVPGVCRFWLQSGNKPTDWSPAPEDYSTTTEMQSSINQTAESIKSTVAATYVNNKTLSSYATKSQLEQTSSSLTSRIQTTETTVSGMSTTVKNVDDYMTFARESGHPTLTIGSSSSSFRTKLTNTGEKFMQGDQTIMELDGITSTVKASRVQMGHYQWRDTGTSMQLVYIP